MWVFSTVSFSVGKQTQCRAEINVTILIQHPCFFFHKHFSDFPAVVVLNQILHPLCPRPKQDRVKVQFISRRDQDQR